MWTSLNKQAVLLVLFKPFVWVVNLSQSSQTPCISNLSRYFQGRSRLEDTSPWVSDLTGLDVGTLQAMQWPNDRIHPCYFPTTRWMNWIHAYHWLYWKVALKKKLPDMWKIVNVLSFADWTYGCDLNTDPIQRPILLYSMNIYIYIFYWFDIKLHVKLCLPQIICTLHACIRSTGYTAPRLTSPSIT